MASISVFYDAMMVNMDAKAWGYDSMDNSALWKKGKNSVGIHIVFSDANPFPSQQGDGTAISPCLVIMTYTLILFGERSSPLHLTTTQDFDSLLRAPFL